MYDQQVADLCTVQGRCCLHLKLSSENFKHVLTWEDPNNESLIYYNVLYSQMYQKNVTVKDCANITERRCDLTKYFPSITQTYRVHVRSFTDRESPKASGAVNMTPIQDTILGPPNVSIVACNCCIQVSIQPPVSHLWSNEEQQYLSLVSDTVYPILICTVKIKYMTEVSSYEKEMISDNYTFTQPNLLPNANYCVSVSVSATLNGKPSIPSEWKCVVTEYHVSESSKVYIIVAAVCGVLLFAGLVLLLVGLDFTGYICRTKTIIPKVLKSLPTSESTFTDRSEVPSPAESLTVEIISRKSETEQKWESENKSFEEGYTNRKKLLLVSDGSSTMASGELPSGGWSSNESSGQATSSTEEDVSAGHLVEGTSSVVSELGSFSGGARTTGAIEDSSNLPINTSGVFTINLNSVAIADPANVWTRGKLEEVPREVAEDSAKAGIVPHQHNVGICLGTGDLEDEENCSDYEEEQDISENSDSDSHLISGYMRR
ncbi:hypothetical protein GDO81_006973 [Engystomops pustulosus]|uniref:Interferon alpha/beta receptor 2 n=3 Tax=Engystomops pustulosus TaxID=76066 RepID=A0AAV7D1W3_ENGPU|nr:hypothetical protein GDO81_006973 [Engystomops pustulosus]